MKQRLSALLAVLLILLPCAGCKRPAEQKTTTASTVSSTQTQAVAAKTSSTASAASKTTSSQTVQTTKLDTKHLPMYKNTAYVVLNNNMPAFTAQEKASAKAFERYAKLDALGRCGAAFACVGEETMPTEKRSSISSVKPSGWHAYQYDFVDGGSLYNRCHLIGYQLTAENANEKNLITGTRYMNTKGMLPFENMVADYVKETGEHVLYRVTPIFVGKELVARGVQMEAYSVEDEGDSVCYNVYCFNVQPGVVIDYKTGESRLADTATTTTAPLKSKLTVYILNTKSKKFHTPDCAAVETISEKNKSTYKGAKSVLMKQGYTPCSMCNP